MRQQDKDLLTTGAQLSLSILHALIDKVKPMSQPGQALRRAIGELSEHATRRMLGRPWPVDESPEPTPITKRSVAP